MQALRIAIILTRPERPPDWCMRLVERICAEPQFELAALLKPIEGTRRPTGNGLIRMWHALERRLAAKSQPADGILYKSHTGGLPSLTIDETAAIEQLDLDVILDLSGNAGCNCSASLARHGVWFLDFLTWEPGLAGLAAVISAEPVTGIALFRKTADQDGCIGISAASLNTKFIAARNELFMCEKAVPLILRELRHTRRFGSPALRNDLKLSAPPDLSGTHLAKYLKGLCGEFREIISDKFLDKVGMRPGMFFLKSNACGWPDFTPAKAASHVSGRNSYFADPFLWENNGSPFCFFEEYNYRTGRGHISVGRFQDGELTEIQVALRTDYHLSFPFLFEHSGILYMMPETSEVRRLEVWKCCEFPNRWERHATALEGVAASDSTLNLIDGTWWLFTNISEDPFLDMNTELHIFKADGPDLTRLEPHSTNPVVVNSRQARNAGRILQMDGKLYRPSQDNSHGLYGYGLRLMEIRRLSLDEYEETAVQAIEPDFEPGIIGCHHLDIRSGRVVMDARKKVGGFASRRRIEVTLPQSRPRPGRSGLRPPADCVRRSN